jgi:hypothetical protein
LGFINPIYFIAMALIPWYCDLSPFFGISPEHSLPATLLVTLIYAHALLWLGRGTWLPIMSPSINLFQSCTLAPVVLSTLLKPFGRPALGFAAVTPKGKLAVAGRINWTVMTPLLCAFLLLVMGMGKTMALDSYVRDVGEIVTNSIWAIIFALHLAIACVAAMELPIVAARSASRSRRPVCLSPKAARRSAAGSTTCRCSARGSITAFRGVAGGCASKARRWKPRRSGRSAACRRCSLSMCPTSSAVA